MRVNVTKEHYKHGSWVQIPPLRPLSYSDLQSERSTDVTSGKPAPQNSQAFFTKTTAGVSGHVWHPDAAINRAWARQAVDLGWVK